MQLFWKENTDSNTKIISVNPKEKKHFIIGASILAALLIVLFATFHIKTTHLYKINTLFKVKLDLTIAHLEFEDVQNKSYLQHNQTRLLKAKNLLNKLLTPPDFGDYILPLYSQKQHDELKEILRGVADFEKFYKEGKIAENTLQHDAVFNTLITHVTNLQNDLQHSLQRQSNLLFNIQILLLVLLMGFLTVVILNQSKFRKKRIGLLVKQQQFLDQLEQSNYFLEASQNVAKLGYYTYHFETKKWGASKYLIELMNFTLDTYELDSWLNILHPDDRSILTDIFDKRLKDATVPLDVTYRIIRPKDGEVRWIHHMAQSIQIDAQGNYLPILGILQDVTHQKKMTHTLELSEKNFKRSQEIAQLGVFDIDLISRRFTSSAIFDKITGFTEEDPKTVDNWCSITHPDDLICNRETLENSIKTNNEFDKEFRILTKDTKTLKWLHSRGEIIYKNGEPTNFVGTFQDITQRKLAEIILKESEQKLLEAHEITHLGSFVFNDQTNLFETSVICDEILGLDNTYKKDIQGWIKLMHPDDYIKIQSLFDDNNITSISEEIRIIRPKNHKIIWVLGHAKKEYNSDGKRIRISGTVLDINKRKLAEEKIKQSDIILNKIDSIVQVVDSKGAIIYVSPSVETLLGYKPEETLGQGWWRLTTSSIKEANEVRNAVMNNILKKIPLSDEIVYREIKTKTGEKRIIQWISSKGVGNTSIFIGVDVTEKYEKDLQFKTLIETANSAIILSDHNGLIIEWNKEATEIFGYDRHEILNKPLTVLIPEKYIPLHEAGFNKANKLGNVSNHNFMQLEGLTKEGHIFPIEMSLNNWETKDDMVYCAFINDISQRQYETQIKEIIYNITKKASSSLNLEKLFIFIKSELSKLINTNNFFIALYDKTTDMISTPYMVDELDDANDFPKGKTLTGYVIDTKKTLLASKQKLKSLKHQKKIEILGPLSECWLGIPLIVGKDVIGAIVIQSYTDEMAYTLKDVALLELIASNIGQVIKQSRNYERINLLNQALFQSPESVVVTNIKGEIEFANPAFTKLSGYTLKEVLGKTPRLLKSGKQSDTVYKDLWQTISNGKTWEGELINKRKDGKNYLVKANISPVKNKGGDITHFVSVQEDITEKRQLEHDFIHAFIDAQEQEKISFGEDLHDGISQILAAESMYIEVLGRLNKSDDKRILEAIHKIRTHNLNAITDARNIAHGLMSKQLKESGLIIAIEHICEDFNQSKKTVFNFTHKGLIEKEVSKDIKINIFRITQEISTNIIRHSGAKNSEISLIKTKQNQLQLIVKDDGVGIDFDKIKAENKGAGLKNIERRVTLLNGKLNLESAPEKGTCYTIVVPLKTL